MTRIQILQAELDECIAISSSPDELVDVRGVALYRAQSITAERMAITNKLAYPGAEAELQRMILEGPRM